MKRRSSKKLKKIAQRTLPGALYALGALLVFVAATYGFDFIQKRSLLYIWTHKEFPVSVDPQNRTITENELVDVFLADTHGLLAAAGTLVKSSSGQVEIRPGLRKEQITMIFSQALGWNATQRETFMKAGPLPFKEGAFSPGMYEVKSGMTPEQVLAKVSERFHKEVLSRYGTSTAEKVPLKDTLIIASIIQKETLRTDQMRLVSGILWNRLFAGMPLQVDATLQYVRANTAAADSWWAPAVPADKYIASPYNTYMHTGLPPGPIANPSVEAIIAALNPVKTPCLFYLNDSRGAIYCSETYTEHIENIRTHY